MSGFIGLSREVVEKIAEDTREPSWVTEMRLKALEAHSKLHWPVWMPQIGLDSSEIDYLPEKCEGCPIGCRPFSPSAASCAAGAEQVDTEVSYTYTDEELAKRGVIVTSLDKAVSEYERLIKGRIYSLVKHDDNKAAALNGAVWHGGVFVYIPSGVKLERPIYARFTSTVPQTGQFERTLIIAEDNSSMEFIEGCTATYDSGATMHCGVVEIFVGKGARVRYSTIQNWGSSILNLTTKRALVRERGKMEWIDGNFGSKLTVKIPTAILAGRGASVTGAALAVTRDGMDNYSGFGAIHLADDTHSNFKSQSIVLGGDSVYIGKAIAAKNVRAKSYARCDSTTNSDEGFVASMPRIETLSNKQRFEHEAISSPVDAMSVDYLRSRGVPADSAESMVLGGMVEEVSRLFPDEFAIEFEALLEAAISEQRKWNDGEDENYEN